MNWILMIVAHCEAYGLHLRIELTGPFYADTPGEDWFAHFYDLRETLRLPVAAERHVCRIGDLSQLGLPADYARDMTLERAHALWNRTFSLRPEIDAYVESYVARHFAGREVLGIHFRGTDKTTEAPRVCWSSFARTLEETLSARPSLNALFVASDEPAFIEYITETFPGMLVMAHEDRVRSRDGHALHVRPAPGMNRDKARDALVNALLLSRCDALVRTASFLSGWASVFNPALPVTMLNRPYDEKLWFPDREVVKRALNRQMQDFVPD
ncbi:MAG: nodulation protein NodZ [Pseudomonadota bacterium]